MVKPDIWLQKVEKELKIAKENGQISENIFELLDELKIHQNELETQNEELTHSQEELSNLFNKYHELYEEAPVGYFTLNKECIINNVNIKGARLLQLEKNHIIGREFSHFISKEDEEKYFFALFKAIAGNNQELELHLKRNKDYFYAYIEIMPLYGDDESYRIIIIDITEHKKADERLVEAEKRYHLIADFTYDWEEWSDSKGKLEYVSPSCERITGYSAQEFRDNPNLKFNIIHPEDLEAYKKHKDMYFKSEKAESIKFRIINRDGKIHWIEHICQPVYYNGEFLGRRASNRDITDHEKLENALVESENNFRTILEAFPEGAFLIDTQGKIIIANNILAKRFNKNSDEIVGLNIYDLLPDKISKKRKTVVEQAIKTKEPINYIDIRNGTYIKSYIHPILNGEVQKLVVTAEDITERKKAENELKLRDKQRRISLEAANAGIWIRDPIGEWKPTPQLNPLFGRSIDDPPLLEEEFRDYIHPEDLPNIQKAWKSARKGESDYNQEYRVIWDDGSIHWLVSKGKIAEENNIPKFMGITYDITERKKAEEKLKESEEKFKILAESSPTAILVYRDNRFLYVNPAAESILGYPKEELMDTNFLDIISSDYKEIVKKIAQKRMEGYNGLETYEVKMITKEGQEKWVEISSNFIQYEGQPAGIVISADITERKRMEDALKKSEEKSRLLIKYAPSMIYEIDFRGPKLISVNDVMCKTLGYTREELLAMNPFDLLVDDSKNIFQDRINKYLAGEKITDTLEYTGRAKDGRIIYGLLNMTFTYEVGKPLGAVVVAQDITERKTAEIALKRSEQWFKTVVDTSPGLLIILDAQGKITYVSPNAEKMTGYTPQEIIKKEEWLVHPYYKIQLQRLFEDALKTRSGHRNIEYESVKKNGEVWWTELSSKPIYDEKGEFNGFVVQLFDITKRKEAEIELNKAYMYNRGLIESSLDPMIFVGPDFKISDLNRAAERISGYSMQEIIGSDFSDYFLDPQKAKEGYLKVYKDGYVRNFEIEMKNKDGHMIPLLSNASVYKDENDEIVGVFISARDMTEIKKTEEALRVTNEGLVMAQDAANAGLWDWDILNNEMEWSSKLFEIFGLETRNNASYETWNVILHPDDMEIANKRVIKALNEHKSLDSDYRIIMPDGKVHWINAKGQGIYNNQGKAVRMLGICINITARKKLEMELKEAYDTLELKVNERTKELEEAYNALSESEAHLRIAMDMSKLGSWEYDVKSDMFTFNDDFYAIYGTTAKKEGGTKMSSEEYSRRFIPPEESHLVSEEITKAIETADPHFMQNIEHSIIRADGEKRYINVRFGVIKDKKGKTIKTYGSNQDITEHKNAEKQLKQIIQELERSNEELQSFAYITSHDLQEPLRTMGSYAGLLKRRYEGQLDEDADDFLEFMVSGAQRMKTMIQGLIEYSHIDRKKKEFILIDMNLNVEKAISNLKYAISESKAEIRVNSLPNVFADQDQMIRVFQNLIGNAIKFKKPNIAPEIHISAKKDNEEYIFKIKDNGIGMEPQYSNQIFEVFKRLHAIGKYKGAGIGLAIVKRIIDSHGGRIWVESQPEVGTTFYFTIPANN